MNPDLERCLEDLERRIDESVERELMSRWTAFVEDGCPEEVFSPARPAANPPRTIWPRVPVNDALADPDRMALQQYGLASAVLAGGAGDILNVRANYGTSILPLAFGGRPFLMDDSADTLPTSTPVEGGIEAIRELLRDPRDDRMSPLMTKVLEMGRRFADIRRKYPKIGRWVHVYHPDVQGPMDICEVVWGSSLFVAAVEEPEVVRGFLDLISRTYALFLRRWYEVAPPGMPGRSVHWGLLHGGRLVLRDDSATNFSPAMYRELIRPFDQRLFDEFGGGVVHFCGRGDHLVESIAEMRGLHALHLTQPELNDMENVFRNTVDKGIRLMALKAEVVAAARSRGRTLRGLVHVAGAQSW